MSSEHVTNIGANEVRLLCATIAAMPLDETLGEALHLRGHDRARQWIVQTSLGQLTLNVGDQYWVDPDVDCLAVSDRVIRFANGFSDQEVCLDIADGNTIVAVVGEVSASVDLVAPGRSPIQPWSVGTDASTLVPLKDFAIALCAARALPSGVATSLLPTPEMWMMLDQGALWLHVDWADFGLGRATYGVYSGAGLGDVTVGIPHAIVDLFLRSIIDMTGGYEPDEDDESASVDSITIQVGTVMVDAVPQQAIKFAFDRWSLVVLATNSLKSRWSARVEAELESAGIDIVESDDTEWVVNADGSHVRIKLHHGHPDVARVSSFLVRSVGESLELLRELGQLNSTSTGARYWLEDDAVHCVADVLCTALETLPHLVKEIGAATSRYRPILASLGTPVDPGAGAGTATE